MKLTRSSKKNISFMYENLFVPYKKLTLASKTNIVEIKDHMLDGDKVIKELLKKKEINISSRPISFVSEVPTPPCFKFIPKTIQQIIKNESREIIKISAVIKGKQINIYFIENELNTKRNYNDYATNMLNWLYVIDVYASKQCSRSLSIYLFMTDLKKKKPLRGRMITPFNVNTGATTSCPIDAEIVIYRREEWFKVFIHETFHSFGLDFAGVDNDSCDKRLRELFNINIQFNAYESYTEMWAEIINAIYCSNTFKLDNTDNFINIFEICLNVERQHSFSQMVNVLGHFNLRYIHLINKKSNYNNEKTCVFAYFIIKTIFMYDFNLFLSWCNKQNKQLLRFDSVDERSIQSFCNLIESVYCRPSFLKIIKMIEDRHENLDELRMTVCELS